MKYCILRKLGGFGVLAGLCVTSLLAGERETVALNLHGASATSASIEALESDRLVAVKSAHFDSGNTDLKLDEKAALDNFARRFCAAKESIIELRGYADGAGSAAQNLALSTERAQAIARFLGDRGVPQERILIIGLGEVDPTGHPRDPEHQRVDIRIFEHSTNDTTPGGGAAVSGGSGGK
jgi:outer membrane protein OmpA-like peptidoglycan-associated protein